MTASLHDSYADLLEINEVVYSGIGYFGVNHRL